MAICPYRIRNARTGLPSLPDDNLRDARSQHTLGHVLLEHLAKFTNKHALRLVQHLSIRPLGFVGERDMRRCRASSDRDHMVRERPPSQLDHGLRTARRIRRLEGNVPTMPITKDLRHEVS